MGKNAEIDRLYALPLSEFTAARNELAKRRRAAGDRGAADDIRALPKPSVAAWAVNQLYHRERPSFDRLMAAGAEQRRAVTRKGGLSRQAGERKRDALNELLRLAQGLLEDAGSKWTPALRQRLVRTLETLAAGAPGLDVPLGRLTRDLQPPGFDALLGASLVPATGKLRKRGTRKKSGPKRPSAAAVRRLEAARARVQAAKKEQAAARRRKQAAAKKLARLERQAAEARKRARAAERRADDARRRAEELELSSRQAAAALDEAARATARAEARLQTDARKLEKLG